MKNQGIAGHRCHGKPIIELDCSNGRLHLDLPDAERAARIANLAPTKNLTGGGARPLHLDHLLQADLGCDFEVLVGCRGVQVPRHAH